jgi:hypothetical protein
MVLSDTTTLSDAFTNLLELKSKVGRRLGQASNATARRCTFPRSGRDWRGGSWPARQLPLSIKEKESLPLRDPRKMGNHPSLLKPTKERMVMTRVAASK